jgi:hypothetical protein
MEKLEFQIYKDIYQEKEVEGNVVEYCTKKDAVIRWTCDTADITDVREVVGARGKVVTDRCLVYFDRHNSWNLVKGSYDEITKIVSNAEEKHKNIGFQTKTR